MSVNNLLDISQQLNHKIKCNNINFNITLFEDITCKDGWGLTKGPGGGT